MTPSQDAAIRRIVRELRHAIGESQTCFAARCGVTMNTILHWETLRAPTKEKLFRLATIAAPIRPDLEEQFITAIVDNIEADFEIPVHTWRRLAAVAESRQNDWQELAAVTRSRQISTDGKPVEKRAE